MKKNSWKFCDIFFNPVAALKFFFIISAFLFFPLAVGAADYYIDFTSGLDTNAGTEAAPLKYHPWMSDFTGAVTLQPGDTVYMKRGEQWVKSNPTAPWITVGGSGTAGNYITTTAYGSGAQPLIKINTDSPQNVIYAEGKSFIKFDNLHIQHWDGTDYGPNSQDGIQLNKDNQSNLPHDWIITNNEIDNIPGVGVQGLSDSYNIVVGDTNATQTATQTSYSNHIHHFGYAGVLLTGRNSTTGRSDFSVYYNYIHDATRPNCQDNEYGIMFSARSSNSNWPAYATAKYNRIEHIKTYEGMDTHGGSYLYYQNNYVYDTMMSMMAGGVTATGLPDTSDHYYIENNIFENPPDQQCNSIGKAFIWMGGFSSASNQKVSNSVIKNNKLFFTTRPSVYIPRTAIQMGPTDNVEIDGNEIYNSPTVSIGMNAIHFDGGSEPFGNITIKNNYIHDWGLRAVYFVLTGMAGPVSIFNNIFYVPWGIGLRWADVSQNLSVYNNTFLGDTSFGYSPTGVIWEGTTDGITPSAAVNIKNNSVASYSGTANYYMFYSSGNMNSRMFTDNNLYYNSTLTNQFYADAAPRNWAGWRSLGYDVSGIGPSTAPLLTNTSGNYSATADFVPLWNSPLIDAGTDVSLTTDRAGNPVYGAPDIGPYEYQPPYTMSTDNVDSSSTIRVYANGKYRNTNTPSGATVGLVVAPTSGFGSGSYSAWMDIKVNTWNTTGTMYRQWTESNTSASAAAHTVKNLTANKYYTVWYTKDGGVKTRLTAVLTNASGEATFTYSLGYSTVVFEMIEDITSPIAFNLAFPLNGNSTASTRPTLSWNTSSDAESGLAKYQLYIDSALDTDNISNAATSADTTAALSCGSHSWYVKALDYAGNSTSTASSSFTVTCSSGGTQSVGGSGGWATPPPPITPTSTFGSATSTLGLATSTPAIATSTPRAATSTPAFSPIATSTPPAGNAAIVTSLSQSFNQASQPQFSDLIQKIPINFEFKANLGYGRRGPTVNYLQTFLASQPEKFYPSNKLSSWFGLMTYRAVVKFQEKYAAEILAPYKLKRGTGFVGVKTRAKINELLQVYQKSLE